MVIPKNMSKNAGQLCKLPVGIYAQNTILTDSTIKILIKNSNPYQS